jgi:hypothetical protein
MRGVLSHELSAPIARHPFKSFIDVENGRARIRNITIGYDHGDLRACRQRGDQIFQVHTHFAQADRRYALGLGCEAQYADQLVYADGLDLAGPSASIGVSCRICGRLDWSQRAFPPVDRRFEVIENERRWVPFSLDLP